MPVRHHLYLFYLATTFWTFFFLGGLWSDYYQTWPWWLSLAVVVVLPTAALLVLGRRLLLTHLRGVPPFAGSCWIAFYFTGPFLVYDIIYLAAYRGLGLSFVWLHWYLSAFYIIPWVVLPPIGVSLQRQSRE